MVAWQVLVSFYIVKAQDVRLTLYVWDRIGVQRSMRTEIKQIFLILNISKIHIALIIFYIQLGDICICKSIIAFYQSTNNQYNKNRMGCIVQSKENSYKSRFKINQAFSIKYSPALSQMNDANQQLFPMQNKEPIDMDNNQTIDSLQSKYREKTIKRSNLLILIPQQGLSKENISIIEQPPLKNYRQKLVQRYNQRKYQRLLNNSNSYIRNRVNFIQQKNRNTQNLIALLQLVQELSSEGKRQETKTLILSILETAHTINDKLQISDEAHLYGLLAQIEAQKQDTYLYYLAKACQLYDKYPSYFLQNKVALINNVALAIRSSKRQGRFKQAIQLFQNVIDLQTKYYTIKDQRTYYTRINLACVYCEDFNKKGIQLFLAIINQLSDQRSQQLLIIRQLAENNYKSYSNYQKSYIY